MPSLLIPWAEEPLKVLLNGTRNLLIKPQFNAATGTQNKSLQYCAQLF